MEKRGEEGRGREESSGANKFCDLPSPDHPPTYSTAPLGVLQEVASPVFSKMYGGGDAGGMGGMPDMGGMGGAGGPAPGAGPTVEEVD